VEAVPDPDEAIWEELTLPGNEEDEIAGGDEGGVYCWVDPYPLDDRPVWEQQADLESCAGCSCLHETNELDANGECEVCVTEEKERRDRHEEWLQQIHGQGKSEGPICRHCDCDPVTYTGDQACRLCYQWLKRNAGKYPPQRLEQELRIQIDRRLSLRWRKASTPV